MDLAVLDRLDDLLLDRLADPLQLLGAAVERELRDRARRSRGSGPPPCGRRRSGTRRRPRAPSGRREGRTGPPAPSSSAGRRSSSSASAHSADHTRRLFRKTAVQPDACDRLPADLQRAREPRADDARARRGPARGRPRARDRRRLARRHRASSPTGSPPSCPSSDVLHRDAKEGLGPAYIAGFRRALADGAELVLEMDCDFSHDPADVPRLIAAAEDGADLVLGSRYVPGGAIPNWGAVRRVDLARREPLRAGLAPEPDPRPDRRVQVLPRARVLETIDLDAIDAKGYAFQIETTYRVAAGRLPGGRGADRVHRPRARALEDEPRDRARGDLEGAAPAAPRARRPSVTWRPMRDVTDASFDARRPRGRAGRSSSTSGRRGAGRARRSRPSSSSSPGRPTKVEFVKLDIDENPVSGLALRRALDPDGDPVRRRRGEGDA